MRIPSQFNEDNLYRRQNRQQNRRRFQMDARRILQMMIALVFVLVMMRQASKPEIYEPFFGSFTTGAESGSSVESSTASKNREADPKIVSTPRESPIDPEIVAKVVDGSVWRRGDFDALYLYLNESPNQDRIDAPLVGVLSLLQQPDVFLNQRVRLRGRVVRSQSIDASDNEFGITKYWQLWIRPHHGVDRPLVVISRSVPADVAAVGAESIKASGPQVVVVGRFLKRLAYQSAKGADLAPVVVGQLMVPTRSADTRIGQPTASTNQQVVFWYSLGLATVIGVSLAALVMWRTSVTANRMRQLRSARQVRPDALWQSANDNAIETHTEHGGSIPPC